MNIFRLSGDLSHLLAIVILLVKMWRTRSCAGISGRSQILFLLVFCSRYPDLFTNFVSGYNSAMKVTYTVTSVLTLYLIFLKFKTTYDRNNDTFRMEFLVVPCAVLALIINHEFTVMEILWAYSIYQEAVAILPQFFMLSKTGKMEKAMVAYLLALGVYRVLYIVNWIYRYYDEGFFDSIAFVSGCVQTTLFIIPVVVASSDRSEPSMDSKRPVTISSSVPMSEKLVEGSIIDCLPPSYEESVNDFFLEAESKSGSVCGVHVPIGSSSETANNGNPEATTTPDFPQSSSQSVGQAIL